MKNNRHEEIILETDNVKVRVIEIQQNSLSKWHHHTEITDDCFCLCGKITVHTKAPNTSTTLNPSERYTIKASVSHCIENTGDSAAKYLLVQGIGKCDFIEDDL